MMPSHDIGGREPEQHRAQNDCVRGVLPSPRLISCGVSKFEQHLVRGFSDSKTQIRGLIFPCSQVVWNAAGILGTSLSKKRFALRNRTAGCAAAKAPARL